MNDRINRYKLGIIAAVTGFGFVSAVAAAPERTAESVTIAVFADRYASGDRSFDDLDALEKYLTPVRGVTVLVCGPRATRSLKAVVHRFRQVPVQIRVPDADERDCMSRPAGLVAVGARTGVRPFGIDDAAVERYWLDIMP